MTETEERTLTREFILPGLPMPTKFSLVGAASEGKTELTAFDRSLLLSGVGNVNLLKVSSILPPGAIYHETVDIPPGILLPIAYGSLISSEEGRLISASVAVGISRKDSYGVIMEFSGYCSREEAEERVVDMLKEAFEVRGLPLNQIYVKAVDHIVKKIGCVFAAVPLWY